MIRPRIIAKLEIKTNSVVKPIFFEGLKKIGNPIQITKKYYNNGIDEFFLIDIVSSLYRREINLSLLKEISKEIFIPITYGGGVKSLKDIENCLKNGADKVCLNTFAIRSNAKLIGLASKQFGSQCIIANIEAKKINENWFCFTDGGRINSQVEISEWIKRVQDENVGEIFLQSIDNDGYKIGPNLDLIKFINSIVNVPLILGSGFRKIRDLKNVNKIFTPDAICLSSALHYNELKIKTVKKLYEK